MGHPNVTQMTQSVLAPSFKQCERNGADQRVEGTEVLRKAKKVLESSPKQIKAAVTGPVTQVRHSRSAHGIASNPKSIWKNRPTLGFSARGSMYRLHISLQPGGSWRVCTCWWPGRLLGGPSRGHSGVP